MSKSCINWHNRSFYTNIVILNFQFIFNIHLRIIRLQTMTYFVSIILQYTLVVFIDFYIKIEQFIQCFWNMFVSEWWFYIVIFTLNESHCSYIWFHVLKGNSILLFYNFQSIIYFIFNHKHTFWFYSTKFSSRITVHILYFT